MFFDDRSSSLVIDALIFLSSKPCPTKPITSNATAMKDSIGSMFSVLSHTILACLRFLRLNTLNDYSLNYHTY